MATAGTAEAAAAAFTDSTPTTSTSSSDAADTTSSTSSGDDTTGSSDGSNTNSTATASPIRSRVHAQLGKLSYRMLVSYDGTAYSGWQLQSRAKTIQAELERALSTVLREDRATLCVCAAGRTDAGVHAVGQVSSGS